MKFLIILIVLPSMLFSQKCDIHIHDERQMDADQLYEALLPVHIETFHSHTSWIARIDLLYCEYGTDIVMMSTKSGFYFFRNNANLFKRWTKANDIGSFFQQHVKGKKQYQDPDFYPVYRCKAFREHGPQCRRLTRNDYCWQH